MSDTGMFFLMFGFILLIVIIAVVAVVASLSAYVGAIAAEEIGTDEEEQFLINMDNIAKGYHKNM